MKVGEYKFLPTIAEAVELMIQLAKEGKDSDMKVLDGSKWVIVRALKGEENETDLSVQDVPGEGMRR